MNYFYVALAGFAGGFVVAALFFATIKKYVLAAFPAKMGMVDSTSVQKIGHNGEDMWVEYHNGRVYNYRGVPKEVFFRSVVRD